MNGRGRRRGRGSACTIGPGGMRGSRSDGAVLSPCPGHHGCSHTPWCPQLRQASPMCRVRVSPHPLLAVTGVPSCPRPSLWSGHRCSHLLWDVSVGHHMGVSHFLRCHHGIEHGHLPASPGHHHGKGQGPHPGSRACNCGIGYGCPLHSLQCYHGMAHGCHPLGCHQGQTQPPWSSSCHRGTRKFLAPPGSHCESEQRPFHGFQGWHTRTGQRCPQHLRPGHRPPLGPWVVTVGKGRGDP